MITCRVLFFGAATLFMAAPSLLAQAVLHQPYLGVGLTAGVYAANHVQIPPGGEAQFWDYGEHEGDFYMNQTIALAQTSSFAKSFPDAQWVVANQNAMGFSSTLDSVVEYGNVVEALFAPIALDDPLVTFKWPVLYGDTFEDTFSVNMELAGDPYANTGSFEATVDGWGSLQSPADTLYDEVLRITWSTEQTEIYAGDTAIILYNRVDYYTDGRLLPALLHEHVIILDTDSAEVYEGKGLVWYDGITLAVDPAEAESSALQMQVSPNPAQGPFTIQWSPNGAPDAVRVLDVKGTEIQLFGKAECAVSGGALRMESLPAGLYFVEGLWDRTTRMQRVIVQ
jgi:hypothetical protein